MSFGDWQLLGAVTNQAMRNKSSETVLRHIAILCYNKTEKLKEVLLKVKCFGFIFMFIDLL